jgi:type IV secretory pathway VirB10-like protein
MSEEFDTERSGLNPLGWWLIVAAIVITVLMAVYGIMHSGPNLSRTADTDNTNQPSAIDLSKIDNDARLLPSPAPAAQASSTPSPRMAAQTVLLPSPETSQSPSAVHTPDAAELWRRQEAQRAREASPIVAAFEPKANQVREIPNPAGRSQLRPPASPWTIDEGSVINAILKFGVNSDYPGDLVAQVERPLYDSATGRYLLVPAGSNLIGRFHQLNGPFQERIGIGWHRLVLPNNWSMPLPEMPSTDNAGFAGMTGDVNHHYASTIGAALFSTLLTLGPTVGTTLAMPSSAAVSPFTGAVYQTDPTQQIGMLAANTAAGQMSSTSAKWMQPYLMRPNTVTIRSGTRLDVFVNVDLVLPGPYHDAAGQLIDAQEVK